MSTRSRGERAGLTREQILEAALALADRAGLKALTMRRLGAELGVEAMTLYHYVPSKDALLDGLVERVFARALPPADADGDGAPDWRAMLRAYADALRGTLLRHPGVLPLAAARPAVTPATLDAVERGLGALTAAGFPLGAAVDALNSLSVFVVAHTAAEAAAGEGDATAPGGADWLAGLDAARYPLLTEAARTGAGVDDAARFRAGTTALITGFATTAGIPGRPARTGPATDD
ncbi:TetR/AcrR family transcriptional regulator C-terminal domain-containing protein [Streptomyces cinnamoneus]|uniref:TetR/AcrR family transcriptional regulator C-terminal domain-containing protein n=1 Tax=Streptomyces cinnamoneus TaxID=53446 RepID=UPI0033E6866F